jgi:hypothetical protein
MTDESAKLTAAQIRQKRVMAGLRMMFHYVIEGEQAQRDLYAMSLRGDLSEIERSNLILLLLETFPPDIAEGLALLWFEGAGYPVPSFTEGCLPDARFWASGANAKELDAYAMASFESMSAARKKGFLRWANGKANES